MAELPHRATALSIHASFRCRHSGACCTSGWAIPIEDDRRRRAEDAIARGRLATPPSESSSPLAAVDAVDLPTGRTALLATDADGRCAFFDRGSRLCAVHRDLGHAALPSACQHFPRICLIDGRGLSVTLSHYCPTAAYLLFDATVPLAIVERPPLLYGAVAWEGLDARGEWPPLLKPGRLMNLASYDAWERFAVATLGREDLGPEEAIAVLAAAAERIRVWVPSAAREALIDRVHSVAAASARAPRVPSAASPRAEDRPRPIVYYDLARQSVEAGLETPPAPDDLEGADDRWVCDAWPAFAEPLRRYLASKAFASWLAYQGHGLLTIVHGLQLGLDVVRVEAVRACAAAGRPLDRALLVEAIRAADLLLLHVVSRAELAGRLSALVEEDS